MMYLGPWIFPVFAAVMWLSMLLAMLLTWVADGRPIYPSMETGQTIAYISDVGAYGLQPLFITGSVLTTVSLDAGFIAERWLRHSGRLVPNTSRAQKVLSVLAILSAIAGSAGLILLSIFDTYSHPRIHNGFLFIFLVGYILSAIFLCAEYQRLGIHYREHRILRISFWVKLVFIFVEIILVGVFIGMMATEQRNESAIFEWIVALVFTFYVLSFVIDLAPSTRTRSHQPQGWRNQAALDAEKANSNDSIPLRNTSEDSNGHSMDLGVGEYHGNTQLNAAGPSSPHLR